jgi:hypothetical protein
VLPIEAVVALTLMGAAVPAAVPPAPDWLAAVSPVAAVEPCGPLGRVVPREWPGVAPAGSDETRRSVAVSVGLAHRALARMVSVRVRRTTSAVTSARPSPPVATRRASDPIATSTSSAREAGVEIVSRTA